MMPWHTMTPRAVLASLKGSAVVNAVFAVILGLGVAVVGVPSVAMAQLVIDPSLPGSGHHGDVWGQNKQGPKPKNPPITLKPDPRQRLDAGALLCSTEAQLEQHEAAVTARLDGREALEPSGCRFVRSLTPVDVLDRHGQARTQVRLPGQTEQTGWTDAVVRDK
jgi:hypothetical protein